MDFARRATAETERGRAFFYVFFEEKNKQKRVPVPTSSSLQPLHTYANINWYRMYVNHARIVLYDLP